MDDVAWIARTWHETWYVMWSESDHPRSGWNWISIMGNSRKSARVEMGGAGKGALLVAPVPDSSQPEKVQTLIAFVREKGLCGNCALAERCRLPEKDGGGWRCSKYQTAGKA
jgi:hypothetical protein